MEIWTVFIIVTKTNTEMKNEFKYVLKSKGESKRDTFLTQQQIGKKK